MEGLDQPNTNNGSLITVSLIRKSNHRSAKEWFSSHRSVSSVTTATETEAEIETEKKKKKKKKKKNAGAETAVTVIGTGATITTVAHLRRHASGRGASRPPRTRAVVVSSSRWRHQDVICYLCKGDINHADLANTAAQLGQRL
ncbi:hypothetical protein PRUPE_4G251200 [Prunus persica]|uniref:Uncharacterized protein n=1 Tax=Prunus persica TaxID=3760 RepID=A0A251PQM0_PRUPE|nr:hypothetical protein PRUPE_4G251200 [Prunus persica]